LNCREHNGGQFILRIVIINIISYLLTYNASNTKRQTNKRVQSAYSVTFEI